MQVAPRFLDSLWNPDCSSSNIIIIIIIIIIRVIIVAFSHFVAPTTVNGC